MFLLLKSKEVILCVTKVTCFNNYYTIIKKYFNMSFVIKLLIAKEVFVEKQSYRLDNNVENINSNLFISEILVLIRNIFL